MSGVNHHVILAGMTKGRSSDMENERVILLPSIPRRRRSSVVTIGTAIWGKKSY